LPPIVDMLILLILASMLLAEPLFMINGNDIEVGRNENLFVLIISVNIYVKAISRLRHGIAKIEGFVVFIKNGKRFCQLNGTFLRCKLSGHDLDYCLSKSRQ
jgi:hypothetical protein